jgi:hypothetical protein
MRLVATAARGGIAGAPEVELRLRAGPVIPEAEMSGCSGQSE